MKRKVVNPNIQEKKLRQIKEKTVEKDLKNQMEKPGELKREMKIQGPTK